MPASLPDRLRRGTENAIIAGTGAGGVLFLDLTVLKMFREPFSKENTR
jgi:hypothetical protein